MPKSEDSMSPNELNYRKSNNTILIVKLQKLHKLLLTQIFTSSDSYA